MIRFGADGYRHRSATSKLKIPVIKLDRRMRDTACSAVVAGAQSNGAAGQCTAVVFLRESENKELATRAHGHATRLGKPGDVAFRTKLNAAAISAEKGGGCKRGADAVEVSLKHGFFDARLWVAVNANWLR